MKMAAVQRFVTPKTKLLRPVSMSTYLPETLLSINSFRIYFVSLLPVQPIPCLLANSLGLAISQMEIRCSRIRLTHFTSSSHVGENG